MTAPRRTGDDFRRTTLPQLDKEVLRLGLASNFGLTAEDQLYAAERGVNYWVWSPRYKTATAALRELFQQDRERYVVAMMGAAFVKGGVRRDVEKALRLLGTDYLDVFQLSWLGRTSRFSPAIQEALQEVKQEGLVRAVGTSIHDRVRAGKLAEDSVLDQLMIRYNAKHPGAEQDIFPHLHHRNPNVISYTATSWRQLLKPVKGIDMPPWPGEDPGAALPPLTAALCYRFVLSSPHLHVALSGPANRAQLDENLAVLDQGPLSDEEEAWVREYGRQVKAKKKSFF